MLSAVAASLILSDVALWVMLTCELMVVCASVCLAQVLARCLFYQISSKDTKYVVFSCFCVNQNIHILIINREKSSISCKSASGQSFLFSDFLFAVILVLKSAKAANTVM